MNTNTTTTNTNTTNTSAMQQSDIDAVRLKNLRKVIETFQSPPTQTTDLPQRDYDTIIGNIQNVLKNDSFAPVAKNVLQSAAICFSSYEKADVPDESISNRLRKMMSINNSDRKRIDEFYLLSLSSSINQKFWTLPTISYDYDVLQSLVVTVCALPTTRIFLTGKTGIVKEMFQMCGTFVRMLCREVRPYINNNLNECFFLLFLNKIQSAQQIVFSSLSVFLSYQSMCIEGDVDYLAAFISKATSLAQIIYLTSLVFHFALKLDRQHFIESLNDYNAKISKLLDKYDCSNLFFCFQVGFNNTNSVDENNPLIDSLCSRSLEAVQTMILRTYIISYTRWFKEMSLHHFAKRDNGPTTSTTAISDESGVAIIPDTVSENKRQKVNNDQSVVLATLPTTTMSVEEFAVRKKKTLSELLREQASSFQKTAAEWSNFIASFYASNSDHDLPNISAPPVLNTTPSSSSRTMNRKRKRKQTPVATTTVRSKATVSKPVATTTTTVRSKVAVSKPVVSSHTSKKRSINDAVSSKMIINSVDNEFDVSYINALLKALKYRNLTDNIAIANVSIERQIMIWLFDVLSISKMEDFRAYFFDQFNISVDCRQTLIDSFPKYTPKKSYPEKEAIMVLMKGLCDADGINQYSTIRELMMKTFFEPSETDICEMARDFNCSPEAVIDARSTRIMSDKILLPTSYVLKSKFLSKAKCKSRESIYNRQVFVPVHMPIIYQKYANSKNLSSSDVQKICASVDCIEIGQYNVRLGCFTVFRNRDFQSSSNCYFRLSSDAHLENFEKVFKKVVAAHAKHSTLVNDVSANPPTLVADASSNASTLVNDVSANPPTLAADDHVSVSSRVSSVQVPQHYSTSGALRPFGGKAPRWLPTSTTSNNNVHDQSNEQIQVGALTSQSSRSMCDDLFPEFS